MHPDSGVALLPHVPVSIKSKKSLIPYIPPQHLGDHLRRCRNKRKLSQGEAAVLIGTQTLNISRWERSKEPGIDAMPAILRFLGYEPFLAPKTLPERMLAKRRVMGWNLKTAAIRLGVNSKTWKAWERGEGSPSPDYKVRLNHFLNPLAQGKFTPMDASQRFSVSY